MSDLRQTHIVFPVRIHALLLGLLLTAVSASSQDTEESAVLPATTVESAPRTEPVPGSRAPQTLPLPQSPSAPQSAPAPVVPLVIDDEIPRSAILDDSIWEEAIINPNTSRIEEPRDALRYAPNHWVSDFGTRGYGDIYSVRGLANTAFFGPPSTILYIDDVPFGENFTFSRDTGPIESIEILRGPQPTTVGRNAYGGLLDLTTRRSTGEVTSGLDLATGSFGARRAEGWVVGPLPDEKGSFRFRTAHDESDGYLTNTTLGRKTDFLESRVYDGAIFLNFGQDWEMGFIVGGGTQHDGAPRITSLDRTTGFYTVTSDVAGEMNREFDHQALRLSYEGDDYNFLSVTSRRNHEMLPTTNDLDFTSVPFATTTLGQSQEIWNQEFRFSDNDPHADWGWNAGLNVAGSDIKGSSSRNFLTSQSQVDNTVTNIIQPIPFPPFSVPLTIRSTSVSDTQIDLTQLSTSIMDEESFATYGGVEYRGFESFTWKGGARVDRVERGIVRDFVRSGQAVTQTVTTSTIDPVPGFPPFPAPPVDVRTTITPLDLTQPRIAMRQEWVHLTPTAGVDWEISDKNTAYATTSYAFKPGGFSPYTNNPLYVAFDEEKAWASEVGVRSSSPDGKTRTNLAAYYSAVEGYQVERNVTANDYVVFNADQAEIYGMEFEVIHAICPTLDFLGTFGYTHARLTDYTDPVSGQNLDDSIPPHVPEFNAVAALDYHLDRGFFTRLELVALGNVKYDDLNRQEFQQTGFSLLNSTIGYRTNEWSISLYGTNLSEKEYYTSKSTELRTGVPGRPREFGVEMSVEF